MTHLIDKDALVAEIEKCIYRCNEKKRSCPVNTQVEAICDNKINAYNEVLSSLNTLEVKDVELMIHTIIAECCDWLAVYTELNHEQIEDCRKLMLTVKDEQLKAKQG